MGAGCWWGCPDEQINPYSQCWGGSGADEVKVLLLGLDGAGKTTLLWKLSLGFDFVSGCTAPTFGYNIETIKWRRKHLTVWEVGGADKIRTFWRDYYQNTRGIIYLIDQTDRKRLEETKELLHTLMQEEQSDENVASSDEEEKENLTHRKHKLDAEVFLIFTSKGDLPSPIPFDDLVASLELEGRDSTTVAGDLKSCAGRCWGRRWRVQEAYT